MARAARSASQAAASQLFGELDAKIEAGMAAYGIPGVAVGDEVVVIGKSGQCSVTALEIAQLLNTVPYEVLCSIGKRVPRIYLD